MRYKYLSNEIDDDDDNDDGDDDGSNIDAKEDGFIADDQEDMTGWKKKLKPQEPVKGAFISNLLKPSG